MKTEKTVHTASRLTAFAAFSTLVTGCGCYASAQVTVRDAQELRREMARAQPGQIITVAPGNYGHGFRFENLQGTAAQPIVITGMQGHDLPLFSGGVQALHFSDCSFITLRNVRIDGCSGNGINADDGGSYDSPSRGMVFESVLIENIGPQGNRDALKLSGLVDFTVRNCRFHGWGGSAIDMVGCRDGVIEHSRFTGKEGFSQSSGVQAKGGSARILIRQNIFMDAGQRAINIGGSTGLQFFRPQLTNYEAREIVAAGNHFVGSLSPIAFVTAVDCRVHYNTFMHPEKWVLRILQEQPTDTFLACQGGVFEHNLILFDRRVQVFVNVGPGTKPDTFRFHGNAWFDSQGDRRPSLPAAESDGVYRVDPEMQQTETGSFMPGSNDARLRAVGAHAYKP